jgi:hypothetical protein
VVRAADVALADRVVLAAVAVLAVAVPKLKMLFEVENGKTLSDKWGAYDTQ